MALKKARLQRLRAGLRPAIDAGVDRAADFIVDLAQQLAPVDTGDLQSTIRKEGETGSGKRQVKAGGIPGTATGELVTHAGYVEYGTDVSPAQPFLTPAADAIDVAKAIKAELTKLLKG